MEVAAFGPGWTSGDSDRFAGRFPLAVERHAMAQVGRLLPGVTTLTAHARYYMLHGLIATEAEAQDLAAVEALALLRRAEVVMSGVSLTHQRNHAGMSAPHGGDLISASLRKHGDLDVAGLSQPGSYARPRSGFWGPYLGSEVALGLVQQVKGSPRPGEFLNTKAVRESLGDLLPLARQDTVSAGDLSKNAHLCLCQGAGAPDMEMLRSRMVPESTEVRAMHREDRRSQTLRMLLRLVELSPQVRSPARDLSRFLAFDPVAADDPVVGELDAFPAWTGVVLRNLSVAGWRDLWSWLVKEVSGFMPVSELAAAFADAMPDVTVRQFRDALPPTSAPDGIGGLRLLDAEYDQVLMSLDTPNRCLSVLFVSAARVGHLPEKVEAYFEGSDERWQQLTPGWMQARITEWLDRPLRDFSAFLVAQLVERSQRIALTKASFDKKTGRFRIPTRVFVREGSIYRDSNEGGGGISLRFNTAITVMGGMGLVEYSGDQWVLTDRGRDA